MKESVRSLTISPKVIHPSARGNHAGRDFLVLVPVVLLSEQKSPTGPNTNSDIQSVSGWKGSFRLHRSTPLLSQPCAKTQRNSRSSVKSECTPFRMTYVS